MQNAEARLAVLEKQMEQLMGNGQPGEIQMIKTQIDDIKTRMWKIVLVLALLQLASGGGTISLKALLGLFAH